MKLEDIDVVILCGGLATRLKGVVDDVPKVLVEINGKPFMDIMLENFKAQGFKRFIFCAGHKGEMIEEYCRNSKLDLTLSVAIEPSPLGTGGAIKNAASFIKSDPFIALNGDCFCRIPLQPLLNFHSDNKALATLAVSKVKDNKDYGGITLENNRIKDFSEKKQAQGISFANVGLYCFNKEVLDLMPDGKFSIEYDFFPKLVDREFFGFITQEEFLDIGTPERLNRAQEEL